MKLLTLVMLLPTLLFIMTVTSLGSVYAQEDKTYSKEPKFYTIQRVLPDIDIFVDEEIKTTIAAESSNQIYDHVPKFFAIQHAQSGSISEINETAYTLELNDISDKTILFSDRPDRIVKSTSTSDFIGNWSTGEDSFAVDPPNAVLVVDENEGKQNIAIVELFSPVYDSDKKTLKYEAIPDNATSIDLPKEFGQTTIVIDLFSESGSQNVCIFTNSDGTPVISAGA